ncbi:MAG TPA: hypothetical protein VIK77_09195 [Tissierellaceae bacterium]
MSKMPDRLYIDKEDESLYNYLKNEIFEGNERNKELFLLAMSIGFKNQIKRSLDKKKDYVREEYLLPEDYALLNAVAMFEKGPEILSNRAEVFKIAEEYAHAGIKILVDEINSSSFESYTKRFEKDIFEIYKKLELGRDYGKEISIS